jgi:hypothetical protein
LQELEKGQKYVGIPLPQKQALAAQLNNKLKQAMYQNFKNGPSENNPAQRGRPNAYPQQGGRNFPNTQTPNDERPTPQNQSKTGQPQPQPQKNLPSKPTLQKLPIPAPHSPQTSDPKIPEETSPTTNLPPSSLLLSIQNPSNPNPNPVENQMCEEFIDSKINQSDTPIETVKDDNVNSKTDNVTHGNGYDHDRVNRLHGNGGPHGRGGWRGGGSGGEQR